MNVLITIFSVILSFVSIAMIFLVLMQKAKSDGGVAAMGGGMAESTFGAETGNVLATGTRNVAVVFFVLSLALYLANVYQTKHHAGGQDKLPTINAPAHAAVPTTAPVTLPAAKPATTTAPANTPADATKKP
ncbi:MAG TPA: preprotein translocase subunit SecG [Candidatus Didemnitutus sp.]|nr:preprotein translocase subunit SecG [Candidatus Didemnitutus sp.]